MLMKNSTYFEIPSFVWVRYTNPCSVTAASGGVLTDVTIDIVKFVRFSKFPEEEIPMKNNNPFSCMIQTSGMIDEPSHSK